VQDAFACGGKELGRDPFGLVLGDPRQTAEIDRVKLHGAHVKKVVIEIASDLCNDLRLSDSACAPDVQGKPPPQAPAQQVKKSADQGAAIRVRVGVPLVARGPAPNIADAPFTEIQLPTGIFRGFTAAGTTFAIDGTHPYDMGGDAATVLKPGPAGGPDDCGQWITHAELEAELKSLRLLA
jgi:hypothetical protein